MPDAADLVAQARRTRVVVIGAGAADGAVAAWECAKVGLAVTLVADEPLADGRPVVDVDGFASDHAALVDALAPGGLAADGLGDLLVPVTEGSTWIAEPGTATLSSAVALPPGAVLGIPPNPWDVSVRRLIGWRGTWRAYLDRLRPPLTLGRERNLGALVRSRMGDRVVERLVDPVTRGTFGFAPEDVDVEEVAPALNAALTRTGSLGGAVAELAGDRSPRAVFGDGGAAWREALAVRLEELSVDVRTGDRVAGLSRGEAGWAVEVAGPGGETAVLDAEAVIIATGAERTRSLLAGIVAVPEATLTGPRDVVRLRARVEAPPWTRFLPGPQGGGQARAETAGAAPLRRITDITAVAPEFATEPGVRVFQVELDGSDASDAQIAEAAREALSAATGTVVVGADVLEAHRMRIGGVLSSVRLGARAEREAMLTAIGSDSVAGLEVAGAWLAGGGFADSVDAAIAAADRVRRHALWDHGSG